MTLSTEREMASIRQVTVTTVLSSLQGAVRGHSSHLVRQHTCSTHLLRNSYQQTAWGDPKNIQCSPNTLREADALPPKQCKEHCEKPPHWGTRQEAPLVRDAGPRTTTAPLGGGGWKEEKFKGNPRAKGKATAPAKVRGRVQCQGSRQAGGHFLLCCLPSHTACPGLDTGCLAFHGRDLNQA